MESRCWSLCRVAADTVHCANGLFAGKFLLPSSPTFLLRIAKLLHGLPGHLNPDLLPWLRWFGLKQISQIEL